MGFDKTEMGC